MMAAAGLRAVFPGCCVVNVFVIVLAVVHPTREIASSVGSGEFSAWGAAAANIPGGLGCLQAGVGPVTEIFRHVRLRGGRSDQQPSPQEARRGKRNLRPQESAPLDDSVEARIASGEQLVVFPRDCSSLHGALRLFATRGSPDRHAADQGEKRIKRERCQDTVTSVSDPLQHAGQDPGLKMRICVCFRAYSHAHLRSSACMRRGVQSDKPGVARAGTRRVVIEYGHHEVGEEAIAVMGRNSSWSISGVGDLSGRIDRSLLQVCVCARVLGRTWT
jgi:hypothetical protein